LEKLRCHGLVLNLEKCDFGKEIVKFLGHIVLAAGVELLVDHGQAVEQFPWLYTRQELQRFLGVINFYRRFLPGAARVLKPFTNALRGSGGKTRAVVWTEQREAAFQEAKQLLCRAPHLVYPDLAVVVSLAVDASASHVGVVLQQQCQRSWQLLAFYSCKLDMAQPKFSAFDWELLAAYLAVQHFRFMLEGIQFTIFSDHKTLSFALHCVSEPWSARQHQTSPNLLQITSVSRVRQMWCGADLSRVETCPSQPSFNRPGPQSFVESSVVEQPIITGVDFTVDFATMGVAQKSCEDCKWMCQQPSLAVRPCVFGGVAVLCDLSTGTQRLLVPTEYRADVFSIHALALVSGGPDGLLACVQCARSKVHMHIKAPGHLQTSMWT
jgi:RNase H-like domain found in reverse transcriptase